METVSFTLVVHVEGDKVAPQIVSTQPVPIETVIRVLQQVRDQFLVDLGAALQEKTKP